MSLDNVENAVDEEKQDWLWREGISVILTRVNADLILQCKKKKKVFSGQQTSRMESISDFSGQCIN